MNYIIFILIVICSILSQHPLFLGTTIASVLKYSWAIPFVFFLVRYHSSKIHKIVKTYFVFLNFFVIYDILFVGNEHRECIFEIDADIINMAISFMVLLTSYLFWLHNKSSNFMRYMCMALLLCISYLGIIIYNTSLSAISLDEVQYAYASKNSISTIILSIIVLCFFNLRTKRFIHTFVMYMFYAFLVGLIFMLKSRATLLGLVYFVVYISLKYKSKKTRYIIVGLLLCFIAYIIYNPVAYEVIVNNIFLNNHEANDFSAVSSGRDEQLVSQWKLYERNPIFGIGSGYVDSFPFEILINYGVVGFVVMAIFLMKLVRMINKFDKRYPVLLTANVMMVVFLLNCLFEAYPPFGPGIKCFLLWMVVGFSAAEEKIMKLKIQRNYA